MGVGDLLQGNKEHVSYVATPLGKSKVSAFAFAGPKFEVLATISEGGSMTPHEVVAKSNADAGQVNRAINELLTSGYIKKMS